MAVMLNLKPAAPVPSPFMRFDALGMLDSKPMAMQGMPVPTMYRDDGVALKPVNGVPMQYSAGRNYQPQTNTPVTINICSCRSKKYNDPAVTSLSPGELVFARRHSSDNPTHTNQNVVGPVRFFDASHGANARDTGEFFSLSALNYNLRSEFRGKGSKAVIMDEFTYIGVVLSVDQVNTYQFGVQQAPRLDAAVNVGGVMNVPNIWPTPSVHAAVGLKLEWYPEGKADSAVASAAKDVKAVEGIALRMLGASDAAEEEEEEEEAKEQTDEESGYWQFEPVVIKPGSFESVLRLGVLTQPKRAPQADLKTKQNKVSMPKHTDWPVDTKALPRAMLHMNA